MHRGAYLATGASTGTVHQAVWPAGGSTVLGQRQRASFDFGGEGGEAATLPPWLGDRWKAGPHHPLHLSHTPRGSMGPPRPTAESCRMPGPLPHSHGQHCWPRPWHVPWPPRQPSDPGLGRQSACPPRTALNRLHSIQESPVLAGQWAWILLPRQQQVCGSAPVGGGTALSTVSPEAGNKSRPTHPMAGVGGCPALVVRVLYALGGGWHSPVASSLTGTSPGPSHGFAKPCGAFTSRLQGGGTQHCSWIVGQSLTIREEALAPQS